MSQTNLSSAGVRDVLVQGQRRLSRPRRGSWTAGLGVCTVTRLPEALVSDVDQELEARLNAAYDEQGIDRSLIRACLAQSPAQRLADLEAQLRFFERVRRVSEPSDDRLPPNPEDAG